MVMPSLRAFNHGCQERRWPDAHLKSGVNLMMAVALPVIVSLLQVGCSPPAEQKQKESEQITEFRVSLTLSGGKEETLELHVTDEELTKELLEEPLRNAKEDLEPKRYSIIGSIEIHYKDGRDTGFVLFQPWGHYEAEKYMI